MLAMFNLDQEIINNIWWSDEATFNLDGTVNRHNCRYWAKENPHVVNVKRMKSTGISVWAAMSSHGFIGPYAFHETNPALLMPQFKPCTVNAQRYLTMMEEFFYPQFTARPNHAIEFCMQDGAPPHFANIVKNWLNLYLRDKWIGRGVQNGIAWPPRSPDLTPCDFSL